jgi:hypothetical protein
MSLRRGNLVIAPDKDTVIETAFGTVSVAAHSVALIMAQPTGTAVYNLDDRHQNSVVLTIGKKQLALAPGRHAMITSHLVERFDLVNPAESINYRNVVSNRLDGDLQAFTSEFSTASVLGTVKQLRAMINSDHPQAKRLANHLLKTSAIMTQIGGGGAYQQHQHPRLTASAMLQ